MIKDFNIENFKGFENLSITNLSRINLIGGKNNVGKTSLLESIFAFYDRYNPDFLIKQLAWRGTIFFSLKQESQHEIWLSAFNNFDLKKEIKFSSTDELKNQEKVVIKIDENFIAPISQSDLNKELPSTTTQAKSKYALHIISSTNKIENQDSHVYFLNNNFQMYVKFLKPNTKIVSFLSSKTLNPILESVRFGELIKKGKENMVIELLTKIEPRLKSIYPIPVSENQTILHADIGLSSKIPLNYMGDGIFRLLSYLTAILNSPNGIVLIDEIENGLHYSFHEVLWEILLKTALENKVQLFVNTHSYEMIKAFNKVALSVSPNDFMYYELYQNIVNNTISINQIDNETLQYKIDNQKSFRGE